MKRVLIANRGEIACRVIRSCRLLGLETVAVYSDADAGAVHVALADAAVAIGPPPTRDSYLKIDNLLAAAVASGADAIHPGYGFLSENAAFAEAVSAASIVFIGPTAESIRDMGDKERARELARQAEVPTLPGSRRFDVGDDTGLASAGVDVGYPLLVKAAAGGGGIGMRRVDDPSELADAVNAAQSMAIKSFGDGAIYLERYVERARHIEIQVFGFGDGRAIHLYERDCSLQRRFQKVIEESPAPGLPEHVLDHMTAAATRLCSSRRYAGAGTIEFVVDADTFAFYFLEMNTRIQVEHPVTEMVTGRDLVAMQIELARGTLAVSAQDSVTRGGNAIECRIYAENPNKNFMPAPGPLPRLAMPEHLPGVRVDTGYRAGDEITIYYDPLIAKVICHGETRDQAIDRMLGALRAIDVGGRMTNLAFLQATIDHVEFRQGRVSTGFIEQHRKSLIAMASA